MDVLSLRFEDLFIFIVPADPKPYESLFSLFCQSAITKADARRPKYADFLEPQRGVTRIVPRIIGTSRRLTDEFQTKVCGNKTKTPASRSDSKRRAASGFEIRVCFLGQMIELAGSNVRLKLPVPGRGDKFLKPSRECGKFLRREPCDLRFDFLNAHRGIFDEKSSICKTKTPAHVSSPSAQSPKAFGVNFCCSRKELRHQSPITDH